MSVVEEIRSEVRTIASDRNLNDDRAFGYWFLEGFEDFSPEEAESCIVDGPWDGGRDAVFFDEDESILKIYQFKFSNSIDYVKKAFADIQKALINEKDNASRAKQVQLIVVSLVDSNQDILRIENQQELEREMIKKQNLATEIDLKHYDLNEFKKMLDRIQGVNLSISFKSKPVIDGRDLIGLINANELREHINDDNILAFNIRKFLGLRKGSVNYQIRQTLENEDLRPKFWNLNNGIVTLCTNGREESSSENKWKFENFTIVNGAQTINTISRFLDDSPTLRDDPIWVVAKVIVVDDTNIEEALILTKTSNSQTATNDKDLRAVDPTHKTLKRWFDQYYSFKYLTRRGEKVKRDTPSITMKDLAQSYVAFSMDMPNVSFSQPGKIFEHANFYSVVFPDSVISILDKTGGEDKQRNFILQRLVPTLLLWKIRPYVKQKAQDSNDLKWKSVSYHILWLYGCMFKEMKIEDWKKIHSNLDFIFASTIELFYEYLHNMTEFNPSIEIPRILKTPRLWKR